MLKLTTILMTALGSLTAAAAPASLCKSSEKIFFSCSVGKKLISVCGATEPSNTYLQYRAGLVGREPELLFPKEPQSPQGLFRFGVESRSAKGGIWNLAFRSNEYTYTLYRSRHSFEPMSGGVAVKGASGKVKYLNCHEPTVIDKLPDLDRLGLPSVESKAIVSGPE
jgi:hypothetical protein